MSFAGRIRQLARERPGEMVYRHLSVDGGEPAFTWPWLDNRSSQVAGALAERGLGHGDRLALGIRNSPQLVLGALAAWKLGAVPVPVRWDLPDWELARLRDVIAAPVHLGDGDVAWIDDEGFVYVMTRTDDVIPAFFNTSGATPNSRHAPYEMPLRAE